MRPCFREKKVEQEGASTAVGDIEAACEQSLAGPPVSRAKPVTANLDLEDALDEFFWNDVTVGGEDTGSSDADGSDNDDGDEDDGSDDLGRNEDGEADDASDVDDFSHSNPRFSRRGNKLYWDAVHVGTLTSWGGNLSCHCRIRGHTNCRSPAATTWPTDSVLIDWVLHGLGGDLDKTEHMRLAKVLLEQHKPVAMGEC